jgi:zinc metalloprotease ZmpA
MSQRLAISAALTVGGVVVAATTAMAVTSAAPSAPSSPLAASALAAKNAESFVAGRPATLHAGSDENFVQGKVESSAGLQYVPYERTYKGLPVRGGDFVVVTDSNGTVKNTSVADGQAIGNLDITPKLAAADGAKAARGQLKKVATVEGTSLVVSAQGHQARLAWETTITGTGAEGYSRLTVDVDAQNGKVLNSVEHVMHGTGTGAINGPNPLSLRTRTGGSGFLLSDSATTNMPCQDAANNTTFTKATDTWGNGTGTNRETGCVDALYTAEKEKDMLSSWLGRNGMDGSGGAWPIRVGLADVNAFYDGTQVQVGHNNAGAWIGSMDVVGHEMGHGIDDHTPGGISGSGTQEFVADTWGAATEGFANEPSPFDVPDYTVGEEVNLVGSGPIRIMYNPSQIGDPNCYSSSVPGMEVHAAAGPGDHWFYLLAEGTNPTNGQPTSPTCNSTSMTGVGIQNAIKIMYNAMLIKTTGASYLKYRTWTLTAAKNLDATCNLFNHTKAAWDAVSVPAQSADPTCSSGGTPSPSPTTAPPSSPPPGGCSGQIIVNGGFESGTSPWSATAGVLGNTSGQTAHSGSQYAWLDGYGTTHTDTLQQTVTIPSGCRATLTYWLHIDSSETTTTTQFDKVTVTANGTSLQTFSNLNKAAGYTQRSVSLNSFAGGSVAIKWTATEDVSLQTSFVVDDVAVTLS